nr:hypothetical protein [Tanacetum cinerariifolium]
MQIFKVGFRYLVCVTVSRECLETDNTKNPHAALILQSRSHSIYSDGTNSSSLKSGYFNELRLPNLFAVSFDEGAHIFSLLKWETSVSCDSERCTLSGIRTSSRGCLHREADFCLEELEGASCVSKSLLEEVEEDLGHHDVS